jgi:hypothetical protein
VVDYLLSRQVFLTNFRFSQIVRINFSTCRNKKIRWCGFLLSRQVSNLNSSDPESDVLPITPRDNFEAANIKKIVKYATTIEFHFFKERKYAGFLLKGKKA